VKPAQRLYRIGAIACAALAVVPGYYAVTLRWAPHADFDIVGILWLMQNMPRLLACLLTSVFGAAAIYCAARAAAD
jgi:hypothetical protein